jgi:hypothetical protein
MLIKNRFAVAMSLAIASSLSATLSHVNAEPTPSSPNNSQKIDRSNIENVKVAPNLKKKIQIINPGGGVSSDDKFKEAPLKFKETPGFVEFSKTRPEDLITNPAINRGVDKVKPSAVKTIKQIK